MSPQVKPGVGHAALRNLLDVHDGEPEIAEIGPMEHAKSRRDTARQKPLARRRLHTQRVAMRVNDELPILSGFWEGWRGLNKHNLFACVHGVASMPQDAEC